MKFYLYKDQSNYWRWRLVATNGKIIAESSESYWNKQGGPYLDRVRYRPIPDDVVKLQSLQAGEIDVMDYVLPRADDVPAIETVLVEIASEHGPFGAKGVGEPPAIPGPAAIRNAIKHATGARVSTLPMRPERVLAALQERA